MARHSRAETVIGEELRAGGHLDMTRFILLSVFIAFTTLLAAAPQAVEPEERSRALHNPHDSLWSQPAPGMYRVRIETTKGIILLGVTRALAPRRDGLRTIWQGRRRHERHRQAVRRLRRNFGRRHACGTSRKAVRGRQRVSRPRLSHSSNYLLVSNVNALLEFDQI